MSKKRGTYKCPTCRTRVTIDLKGGGWYWGEHNDPSTGKPCALSGKRMG